MPRVFLGTPGTCGLRPCARSHLKKGLVPYLPVRWGVQQIPRTCSSTLTRSRIFLKSKTCYLDYVKLVITVRLCFFFCLNFLFFFFFKSLTEDSLFWTLVNISCFYLPVFYYLLSDLCFLSSDFVICLCVFNFYLLVLSFFIFRGSTCFCGIFQCFCVLLFLR